LTIVIILDNTVLIRKAYFLVHSVNLISYGLGLHATVQWSYSRLADGCNHKIIFFII